jgi:hypothetical protein
MAQEQFCVLVTGMLPKVAILLESHILIILLYLVLT